MRAGKVETMKMKLLTVIGLLGSWIASLFGGWDAALVTLLTFAGDDSIAGDGNTF